MTDFLARLAARAVGEEDAVARPRLPARFEAAAPPASGAELPIVEDDVAADPGRATDRQEAVDRPTSSETPPAGTEHAGEPPRPVSPNEEVPSRPDARRPPDRTRVDPDALVARAAAPPPARRTPDVTGDPRAPAVTPATPAAPVVPAAAARPAPFEVAAPPMRSASPPLDDTSPTVRIHIGRLEVRANLVDPAPPRSRARDQDDAREPARLSLSDYLRGER
jgi:hypothetical protein